MPDSDYVLVHEGAVTNTTPGSKVYVDLTLNGPPICENMTDTEFRKRALRLRDIAISLIDKRLAELTVWSNQAQDRVSDWFGRCDAVTRNRLMTSLPELRRVLSGLQPKNFLRATPELDRYLGCTPNTKNIEREMAHVCAPNTATHTICISPAFCTARDVNMFGESKLATIIHEATHFTDTFGSLDNMYGFNSYMKIWAHDHPDLAIANADSIALYIVYAEDVRA